MAEHLSLPLQPRDPFSLRYFVVHSGVAAAYAVIEEATQRVLANSSAFELVYIYGARGAGKTHLSYGFARLAIEQGVPEEQVEVVELEAENVDSQVSSVVSCYQQLKTSGGLMVISSQKSPTLVSDNPHLQSRLLAGNICEISYPQENELKPLLMSLAERRNMLLSDQTLDYLLRRLPLNPLSFDNIFARLDEFSLSQGKAPGQRMLREMLQGPHRS